MGPNFIFRQLLDYESFTYSYLLADAVSGEAILIDPVLERVDRDLKLIGELGLRLRYVLETHIHADHVTGAGRLRERTSCEIGVAETAGAVSVDVPLKDGDSVQFGGFTLRALATPGHTAGCLSYLLDDRVFTGDALFVRGTGRTDFQQGSAQVLFSSIKEKLFRLPPQTLVFPAHDYNGQTCSTIGEEKDFNPRITDSQTSESFSEIMKNLKLAHPKRIDEAVPANLRCGVGYAEAKRA